jgi:diadenosine tetraphosphatase ApaH/serine/threonine PP2A family protein phosphatase
MRDSGMRIAVMSDIHANREAFSACLKHAADLGVDRYVFLGDYVGYGADPGWAADTVMHHLARGAVAIRGNHDDAISAERLDMNAVALAAIEWTRTQLDASQRAFLAGLPLTIEEADRLYVHASAWAPADWNYVVDSYEALQSLEATSRRLTFCGHVHVPVVYRLGTAGKIEALTPVADVAIPLDRGRRWLAVIGAVGQPRDGVPDACYAVLDDEESTLTYLRVPYDIEGAAAKIRAAGLPSILAARLAQGY